MPNAENEEIQLSASTLAALTEFIQERDTRQQEFEDLKAKAENDFNGQEISIEAFEEDWNISQFWYNDTTATTLARELLRDTTSHSCIAVVSAPSVFIKLKHLLTEVDAPQRPEIRLLEYDTRFNVFKDFVPYDFSQPLRLEGSMRARFDRILCDPPFLSTDCQTKTATTVRWLAKSWDASEQRVIVCTGERMESLILRLYGRLGVRTTAFVPQHTKGLSNEFRCYANFSSASWGSLSPQQFCTALGGGGGGGAAE